MRGAQKVNEGVNRNVNALADSIRFAHDQLGLSYRYLAKLLNVTPPTVFYWVKGKRKPSRRKAREIQMMIEDIIEGNSYSADLSYFSPYHMGPPDNQFSFRPLDSPKVRKALSMLTRYAHVLHLNNRVLLDTAGLIIRRYMKESRVRRQEVGMLSLAALKVAMLKHGYTWSVSHLVEDRKLYGRFFRELALKHLAD